jgi:chromosome segregation ATPase
VEILLGAVAGLVTGLVGAYVALRMLKPNIKIANSQATLNETQGTANVGKTLSDAALLMSSVLNEAQEQNVELRKQSKEARDTNRLLEGRLVELENGANEDKRLLDERNKQHAENNEKVEALQAGMEALNRQIEKDTQETQKLRIEVQTLRGQIVELEEKNRRYVRVNQKLIKALEDAKIPLPDMNGDMTESQKLQAVKK